MLVLAVAAVVVLVAVDLRDLGQPRPLSPPPTRAHMRGVGDGGRLFPRGRAPPTIECQRYSCTLSMTVGAMLANPSFVGSLTGLVSSERTVREVKPRMPDEERLIARRRRGRHGRLPAALRAAPRPTWRASSTGCSAARGDLEDVIQEVFVQVYKSLKDFRGQSKFSTWLHRVTVNVVLMHRRVGAQPPRLRRRAAARAGRCAAATSRPTRTPSAASACAPSAACSTASPTRSASSSSCTSSRGSRPREIAQHRGRAGAHRADAPLLRAPRARGDAARRARARGACKLSFSKVSERGRGAHERARSTSWCASRAPSSGAREAEAVDWTRGRPEPLRDASRPSRQAERARLRVGPRHAAWAFAARRARGGGGDRARRSGRRADAPPPTERPGRRGGRRARGTSPPSRAGGSSSSTASRRGVGATLRAWATWSRREAAPVTLERPGKLTLILERGTRATVTHVQGALGARARAAARSRRRSCPCRAGEAFAVDVGGSRVAVHGTHLRVARDGRARRRRSQRGRRRRRRRAARRLDGRARW